MLRTISKGSVNNDVKIAKYLTGYSKPGKAGSTFDSGFRKHIMAWQTEHGLTADGCIGPATWAKIAEYAPYVCKANKGAVYAFQIATGLTANGSYNTATKNVILAYQKALGITMDGVCRAVVWRDVLALTPVAHRHTKNYKQNDPKWKNVIYSRNGKKTGQTIGNSGCGPTSAASILALKNPKITPVEMCAFAVAKGDRRWSGGTDGKFFTHFGDKYGYRVVETKNVTIFKHCLDKGGYVICAFKAGSWWTSCGHYSPAWKYDSKYFYVDNTISSIKIRREMSKLTKDCRMFYCVYPK